ncbi:hypothetical protein FJT64_021066 [Amphibalanus amphitrite]|uniref:Apple domain-containing protein n=1 Tax=Amphibalanus amphitrite TaxID=1232801 RepID=A0A6A4WUZ4_AMPAM|nr:hypothetical protein FJT64_021066 [Amphibalanus amphitrite]
MHLLPVSVGRLPHVQSLLMMVVLVVMLLSPTSALVASGRRGQGRRLVGATPAETLSAVSQERCHLACHQRGGCRSFNFHPGTGHCQVFTVTACDSSSYIVEPADGWTFYDVVDDLSAESGQTLWSQEACVRDGRCRDSCLRRLGQGCRHTQQCQPLVTGVTNCSELVCSCSSDYWRYNETLCLPRYTQLFTDGESWVWKKIVNGMCSTDFRIKSTGTVEVGVFAAYTHYTGRYFMRISQTKMDVFRYVDGVSNSHLASISKTFETDSRYVRFNFHWCGGQLRISRGIGTTNLFSWNDASPLQPQYLAMRSSSFTEGYFKFAGDLVDPWFGDWSSDRVYSIPRDTMIARRRHEQDFWVEFECRITRDCNWMAREQTTWHGSNIWKVIIGGWDNSHSAIHRHVSGVGWQFYSHTATPAILSATELRRFRIHFSPQAIRVYRDNQTEPFMAHQVGAPFTINYDGPHMCCNVENVDFRLVQYDAGWGYEGGFRWGEDLVS